MVIPGLPSGVIVNAVQLLTADALSILGVQSSPQWGLFQDGIPVVIADNVLSFDFRQDYRISDYPVEQGAFESYNKVASPFDVRLQFSAGGSVAKRQELIDSVDAIIGSTDLFDAVTPEKVFMSINPVHQSIRRTSRQGSGLVVIDLYCRQVRVTAVQQFTNNQQTVASASPNQRVADGFAAFPNSQINDPQSASAAPQVSDGAVQTASPAPGQFDLSQALP